MIAAIAMIAVLAYLAGGSFNRTPAADGSQNPLSQDLGSGPTDGIVRGPDISQLSPQERADRLYNRVMLLANQGKSDSVLFFAPMAIESYRMLAPLNSDQRYDLGRIAEVAGAYPLARAQADSILADNPSSLLGLVLAARVAGLEKRPADSASMQSKLVSVYESESAKKLPEYERHSADIQAVLGRARK